MKLNAYHQKKTKERIRRVVIKIGMIAGALIALGGVLLWAPYFRISHVATSVEYISSETIAASLTPLFAGRVSYVAPRNHILFFSEREAEQLLAKENIGLARVTKHFPNTLEVEFLEYTPYFLYCFNEECFYLDQTGMVSERAPTFSASPLPIIEVLREEKPSLGDAIISPAEAEFLMLLFEKLESLDIAPRFTTFLEDIYIETTEGWEIILSPQATDSDDIVNKLSLLLSERIKEKRANLAYIDLRVENKAFYKFR